MTRPRNFELCVIEFSKKNENVARAMILVQTNAVNIGHSSTMI